MIDFANAALLWFIVGLILALAEFVMPGFIVVFFGFGAWLTAAAVWLGLIESFNAQLIVFLVSSIASLLLLRKRGEKYFKGLISKRLEGETSMDDIRGQKAIASTDVLPGNPGEVEFNGTAWKAESGVKIVKGSQVEIVERRGLVLVVKPV